MQTATKIALGAVRLTGFIQVLLGILFWTGRAIPLVPVHMTVGLIFVLGLWVLAGVGVQAQVDWRLSALAAGWGAVVVALGMTQTRLLIGPMHWIVQVAHLLVGIAAMALGNVLARQVSRSHITSRPAEELRLDYP